MYQTQIQSPTIDELCFTLKCKTFALEHLDEQTEARIQAKINNLKGVMNYHKEQKRKKLITEIADTQAQIDEYINNITK